MDNYDPSYTHYGSSRGHQHRSQPVERSPTHQGSTYSNPPGPQMPSFHQSALTYGSRDRDRSHGISQSDHHVSSTSQFGPHYNNYTGGGDDYRFSHPSNSASQVATTAAGFDSSSISSGPPNNSLALHTPPSGHRRYDNRRGVGLTLDDIRTDPNAGPQELQAASDGDLEKASLARRRRMSRENNREWRQVHGNDERKNRNWRNYFHRNQDATNARTRDQRRRARENDKK